MSSFLQASVASTKGDAPAAAEESVQETAKVVDGGGGDVEDGGGGGGDEPPALIAARKPRIPHTAKKGAHWKPPEWKAGGGRNV